MNFVRAQLHAHNHPLQMSAFSKHCKCCTNHVGFEHSSAWREGCFLYSRRRLHLVQMSFGLWGLFLSLRWPVFCCSFLQLLWLSVVWNSYLSTKHTLPRECGASPQKIYYSVNGVTGNSSLPIMRKIKLIKTDDVDVLKTSSIILSQSGRTDNCQNVSLFKLHNEQRLQNMTLATITTLRHVAVHQRINNNWYISWRKIGT